MIAPAKSVRRETAPPAWHTKFVEMMPIIENHARIAFRYCRDREARQEAIEETLCNACVACSRLFQQGKADLAYPTVLACYGVAQVKAGRKVGCRLNVNDITSDYCQRRKNVTIERLDTYDMDEDAWHEIVLEDKHAGPAETAAARIDVGEWFRRMRPRQRRIAQSLAVGERTTDVAKRFKVSPGRIAQLRAESREVWLAFQGEGCREPMLSADAA